MVCVGVTSDNEIDGIDVESLEVSVYARGASVEDYCVRTLLDDGGVALTDVHEMDFELLGPNPPGE
jgi:hypothetical protein